MYQPALTPQICCLPPFRLPCTMVQYSTECFRSGGSILPRPTYDKTNTHTIFASCLQHVSWILCLQPACFQTKNGRVQQVISYIPSTSIGFYAACSTASGHKANTRAAAHCRPLTMSSLYTSLLGMRNLCCWCCGFPPPLPSAASSPATQPVRMHGRPE